jgi:hypothetical protein
MKNKVELTETGTMLTCTIITDGANYYLIDKNSMIDWNGQYHQALPCDAEGTVIKGASPIEAWPVYEQDEDENPEIIGYATNNPN